MRVNSERIIGVTGGTRARRFDPPYAYCIHGFPIIYPHTHSMCKRIDFITNTQNQQYIKWSRSKGRPDGAGEPRWDCEIHTIGEHKIKTK